MSRSLVITLVLTTLSGCAGVNYAQRSNERYSPPPGGCEYAIDDEQDSAVSDEPEWEYRIQIGDALEVKFFHTPELNERVVVRPDGRISLQLIEEVVTFNLTPSQLTSLLKDEYAADLDDPEIAVIVQSFSAQRIYVSGEVGEPGEFALVGPLTALQAVARAGGFKDTARLSQVIIIRRKPDRSASVLTTNLKHAINGTDPSQDIPLMPYDVVFVSRSNIANVNKWVHQYIRRNIPLSFGFRLDVIS